MPKIRCPYCDNLIQESAKRCKYCKKYLSQNEILERNKSKTRLARLKNQIKNLFIKYE